MAWVALILSVVVLWVASLCKILQGSSSASKSTFLKEGGSTRRRNVLLVIAHPDDESIFQPGKYIFWTIRICRFFLNGLDGFGKVWDWNLLSSIIDKEMSAHSIDLIITFDEYGISGHCNHCDVHQGVRKLVHDTSGRHFEAWELVSTNIVRKYIGPVDIWLSILLGRCLKTGQSHCLLNLYPRRSYDAMAQHSSQWVWYRKLFVAFSSYTYVNTLKKIA